MDRFIIEPEFFRRSLLTFLDAVSELEEPREIMAIACKTVGDRLKANRSGYSEVSDDGERMAFQVGWSDGVLVALTGSINISSAGEVALATLRAGRTLVIEHGDPSDERTPPVWKSMGAQASISVPLVREGRYSASLWVHQAQPRVWTSDEIAFVEDIAARTWDAVKRARAEDALKTLNASLRQEIETQTHRLREREAQWLSLFGQMQEGVILCQVERNPSAKIVNWKFLEVNPAWERLFGASREQVIGQTILDLRPEQGGLWLKAINEIFKTGASTRFEGVAVVTKRQYESDAFKIDDERFAVVFLDTTERTAANEALKASEARLSEERSRLAALVEHLPVGVCFVNLQGAVLLSNPAYVRFQPYDLMPSRRADDPDRWKAWDSRGRRLELDEYVGARALRGETVGGVDFLVQLSPETALWTRVSGVPIKDVQGAVVAALVVVDDIDEQVKSKEALQQLNLKLEERVLERTAELESAQDALRQSQKMEALGQLTGGIAHDFNNLLAGISGSLELLASRIAQGRISAAERYIETAQGATKRAAALTHRLLAFSRRQTLSPVVTDLGALTSGMEELIRRAIGPLVETDIQKPDGLWTAEIDPNQFENALLNLCINARDAMPSGGRLIIRLENNKLVSSAADPLELPPGDYIALSVSDTGMGMSADVISRIFDPFFTTKPTGQGTGLGLSMIYGFVRQSGGQVQVTSQLGVGSTLTLYFPRRDGEAGSALTDEPARSVDPQARSEVVLVVDDELSVRLLITEVLQDIGFQTVEAADGSAAMKILDGSSRIDLLVSDVGLPGGLNGRQVADAALIKRPGLKVLLVTGYADPTVLNAHSFALNMKVLTKPFAVQELVDAVQGLVA